MITTSGSSGQPKPAVHSWGNHYYNALGSNETIPLTAKDRWVLSLPLYHVAGIAIVVRTFVAGAAMVIPTEDDLSETFLKRGVTHASLVTTQMLRLLQDPDGIIALKSLKYILLGGSAIPAMLLEQAETLKLNVYISYGLTEMASQVATGKAGSGVKILKYRQLKIDETGEVSVKGETLFKGYIKAGRVHLTLTQDGWFKTGDLGKIDTNGCPTISGRRDNMFISGGENIQPEEIERVLLSITGIIQAVVIAKEDAEFGSRPVAFIQFAQNTKITDDQIIEHCKKFLPKFKVPTAFYPWPEDLIVKSIKISRSELLSTSAFLDRRK